MLNYFYSSKFEIIVTPVKDIRINWYPNLVKPVAIRCFLGQLEKMKIVIIFVLTMVTLLGTHSFE